MVATSLVIERFMFAYAFSDSSELLFSRYHYDSYQDASEALDDFLRSRVLKGIDIFYSNVFSFSINVVKLPGSSL